MAGDHYSLYQFTLLLFILFSKQTASSLAKIGSLFIEVLLVQKLTSSHINICSIPYVPNYKRKLGRLNLH